MPWDEVREFLALVTGVTEIVSLDVSIHEIGINIAERFGYSVYDSMIIAAAMQSNCTIVFSEDMQHGQTIDGLVKITNPFI